MKALTTETQRKSFFSLLRVSVPPWLKLSRQRALRRAFVFLCALCVLCGSNRGNALTPTYGKAFTLKSVPLRFKWLYLLGVRQTRPRLLRGFFSECCFGTSMQMIKVHLPLALQRVAGYFCWPICDLRPIFKIKPTEFILLSQFRQTEIKWIQQSLHISK